MSKLRKKVERACKAAFDSEEKARLIKEIWWNTSDGLKARFPGVKQSQGWVDFRIEYDKPKNQKKRLEEWYLSRSWKGFSPELHRIIDLAENAIKGNVQSGKELASAVLTIAEGKESFKEFVESVKLERERESGVSEACWALKQFIERSEKKALPTQNELNREAFLINNLKLREIPLRVWEKKHSVFEEFRAGQKLDGECLYSIEIDNETENVRIHTYVQREVR